MNDKRREEPARTGDGGLIPKHGGYQNTKSWQLADLIYDVTVRFCDKFVDRRSRTHDQMVQAARSGCQNLQEGSLDSATSKKIEMKLTGTSRGSLEELQRDYRKFLSHRNLPEWPPEHPALKRFKRLRCNSLEPFRAWVRDETIQFRAAQRDTDQHGQARTEDRAGPSSAGRGDAVGREDTDQHGQARTEGSAGERAGPSSGSTCPCGSVSVRVPAQAFGAVCAANGALSLLNLCIHLVKRQMGAQAETFEKEGGFTERLYRTRHTRRQSR